MTSNRHFNSLFPFQNAHYNDTLITYKNSMTFGFQLPEIEIHFFVGLFWWFSGIMCIFIFVVFKILCCQDIFFSKLSGRNQTILYYPKKKNITLQGSYSLPQRRVNLSLLLDTSY